jgi:signal recognition particle subunit SRP9
MFVKLIIVAFDQCLKYKTDQAQEAKKMEKLNNIFFTLMARGPDGMSFVILC